MAEAIGVQTSPEKSSPTVAGVSQRRSLRAATSTTSPVQAGPEKSSPTVEGVVHCSSATKTGQTVEETALKSSGKSSAETVEEAIHSTLAKLPEEVAR